MAEKHEIDITKRLNPGDVERVLRQRAHEDIFERQYRQSTEQFVASFVDDTAERFLRSGGQGGEYQERKLAEAKESSYRTREALGRSMNQYLTKVIEAGGDVKQASLYWHTVMSRAYWTFISSEKNKFHHEFTRRAEGMNVSGRRREQAQARQDWVEEQMRILQNAFQDVFGRLCGVMNGMNMEMFLKDNTPEVPDTGDPDTRARVEDLDVT